MRTSPGKVIDMFMEKLKYAYDYTNKPVSWALYETWKWADRIETPRKKDKE